MQTAAYLLNRVGSRSQGHKTPFELWSGQKPSVQHLRVFGCVAYALVPKLLRKKLDAKSKKTIFVGYCTKSKGAYRLWDMQQRRLLISRDVIFDENASLDETPTKQVSGLFMPYSDFYSSSIPHQQSTHSQVEEIEDEEILIPQNHEQTHSEEETSDPSSNIEPSAPHPHSPRPQRIRRVPEWYRDFYVPRSYANLASSSTNISVDPMTYTEAMSGEHASEWLVAMQGEIDALKQNKTWKLVVLPKGRKAIGCK